MDCHVIVIIGCVFVASLLSILFINKFFKNKTYEEAAAEKKALVEKLYPTKVNKKIKKISIKKESKKDRKQRVKDSAVENDVQDSDDIEEEENQSVESSPSHNIKTKPHVEFSQPHELSSEANIEQKVVGNKSQSKKKAIKTGILLNKTETSPIQETDSVEILNHFEKQHPKDVVELKKQHKEEQNLMQTNDSKTVKNQKDTGKKSNKTSKKDYGELSSEPIISIKEVKITEMKSGIQTPVIVNSSIKTESPKSQGNKKSFNSNKTKNIVKEMSLLDKIGHNDVIGVNCLMQLFAKAELNRNDIQILIDFLLNKQQDTAAVAHEWSDDVVTKLRKQLSEKEKALHEEIEASAGIQAKLKDLRIEINTERAQFNANIKAYTEELQAKKNEIILLTTEIQNLTEKMQLERQQFQAKLRHEKQVSSQELLTQIQQVTEHNTMLQNEIVQKNSFINDLQIIRNASHQTVEEHKQKLTEINEIYQQKLNQIPSLETSLSEANETIQRLQYDLEMAKISENEKEGNKVEIRNLQNALETTKSELGSANKQINESQQQILTLNHEIEEIRNQFGLLNSKCQEYSSESVNMKNSLENYKTVISEKDSNLFEFENKLKQMISREDDLMKQISEQREKNNDLRTKNWKLNEALQTAENNAKKLVASNNKSSLNNLVIPPLQNSLAGQTDQQTLRDIFQRLFPDAVKKHSATALSLSFDQWIEQIVRTHIEQITIKIQQKNQQEQTQLSSSENCSSNNNHHSPHNHSSVSSTSNNSNSSDDIDIRSNSSNNSNINNVSNDNNSNEILTQNIKLKAQIEELTNIVTKTESMLKHLENQARDQDTHWRKIVQSKQEEINMLKNANGEMI